MTTIIDRTDHNRFANEQQQRYVEQRLRELNAFEVRASGLANPFVNTATASARVATPPTGAMTMNVHQTDTLSRPSSLFHPAEVTSAYMKLGLLGFQGSGKTKTAGKVVIGLVQYMKERGIAYASKPVMFLDTETGSDWLIPDFKAAGIRMDAAKTRSFADLLTAVDEAEANGSALIIDSITHFWMELTQSYMKKKNRSRLQFEDWGYLKAEWGKFTDRFVNSSAHIALCGRAGFEYDYTVDEDTQKKNLEKTGVKMKAEGEMGYEPSLLVLMERQQEIEANKIKRVWRTATILKDRAARLDGQSFEDPGFEQFLPHIQMLNLGGRQMGVDTSRNSQHLITADRRDWQPVQRRIVIDETKDLLTLFFPGQTAQDKTGKLRAMLDAFNASWAEIEEVMPLSDLRAGYDNLHVKLHGKPSKYGSAIARDAESLDMNDGLPAGMAPLKDITLSAQALATPLVKAALQDAAAGPEDDGIPVYLKRQTEPAVTPLAPTEPEIDEPKFLAEVTKALEGCINFVNYGDVQENILNPAKPKLSAPTWEKASRMAMKTIKRLMNTEVPGASFAAAAE